MAGPWAGLRSALGRYLRSLVGKPARDKGLAFSLDGPGPWEVGGRVVERAVGRERIAPLGMRARTPSFFPPTPRARCSPRQVPARGAGRRSPIEHPLNGAAPRGEAQFGRALS